MTTATSPPPSARFDFRRVLGAEPLDARIRLEQLETDDFVVKIGKRTHVGDVLVARQCAGEELLGNGSREAADFANRRCIPGVFRMLIVRVVVGSHTALPAYFLGLERYP